MSSSPPGEGDLRAYQRRSGRGEPKKGQSRKVWLFSITLISSFLGPSILGGMSASSGARSCQRGSRPPTRAPWRRLTQDTDEGVGQQVAVLVGGVALVHGTAAHLHGAEDDGVTQNLSARDLRRTCNQTSHQVDSHGRGGEPLQTAAVDQSNSVSMGKGGGAPTS